MKNKSNITVVIPCFNDGNYIMEAINSILSQTLKADKIIIIDDGSNQETKAILNTINKKEVEIVFQENQGVSKARNVGISLAKTEYILTLDADDSFEPTFIEKALAILKANTEVAIVGSHVKVIYEDGTQSEIKYPLGGTVNDFLVKNNGIASCLYRKECWKAVSGYDEKMHNGYEDWEFWISILKEGKRMHIIEEPLFNYRIKKESRDKNAVQFFDFELREYIFKKHKALYLDNFESYSTQLLYSNSKLRKHGNKLKISREFKIGKAILAPLRFFKTKMNIKTNN